MEFSGTSSTAKWRAFLLELHPAFLKRALVVSTFQKGIREKDKLCNTEYMAGV